MIYLFYIIQFYWNAAILDLHFFLIFIYLIYLHDQNILTKENTTKQIKCLQLDKALIRFYNELVFRGFSLNYGRTNFLLLPTALQS